MTRYTVAIDARRLVRRMTGIGQYVLQLARRMPALSPDLDFELLVDRPLSDDRLPDGCRQIVLGRFVGDGTPVAKAYSPFWLNYHVARHVRRTKVALFHGTNFVIPRRPACRAVATIHDLSFLKLPKAYGPAYRQYMTVQVKAALRHADAVVAVSNATRRDLAELMGVATERVTVIHHGIGDEFHAPIDRSLLDRARERLALPERYVLHVGVVETRKNIETLLRASVGPLKDGLADAIVLAGRDGLNAAAVRRLAAELGVAGATRFLGYVPQQLLPALYSLAQVVVFPSWYEGFGMPVLEGMAAGVPVVASRSSSIPEVAGDAALLFDPADCGQLEVFLRNILSDEALAAELRRKGLERAARFSWTNAATRHIEVYRKVLAIEDV